MPIKSAQSAEVKTFLDEIAEVCRRNEMVLGTSGYDDLEVRTMPADEEQNEDLAALIAAKDETDGD